MYDTKNQSWPSLGQEMENFLYGLLVFLYFQEFKEKLIA